MARRLRIAVIGAGIGGLAAACALRQRGLEAHVYERAAELGEVGAGLQLGPNAVKVLRALGIEQALDALAFEPTNIVSVSWDRAELRFREPLKAVSVQQYGARYLTTHRADLHRLLQAQLPDRSITLGARCTGAAWRDGTAVATFEDGRTIEADVIVGADGINSEVRASLFGLQPAALDPADGVALHGADRAGADPDRPGRHRSRSAATSMSAGSGPRGT